MVVERFYEMTAEEFDTYALAPEHIDRNLEFLDGEISEKMVANPRSSIIAGRLNHYLNAHIIPNKLGYVTTADGGYKVGKHRLMPDVGFVKKERFVNLSEQGYQPIAPDLAIEVISPTDKSRDILKKVMRYVENGTVVWLVDPLAQTVTVYESEQAIITYTAKDTLDGGNVLHGFTLQLSDVFED